jgi:regulator of PEP synthase PpsR (kinase-PPPase family)
MSDPVHHIHLVSDSTGETINTVVRACLAQFENIKAREHYWNLIRTPRQLDMVKAGIEQAPGLVLYTFVDESLRHELTDFCRAKNINGLAVLDPVLKSMTSYFGVPSVHTPGRQHALDAGYFARIDAMDFAMAQDDGHGADYLHEADVLILGVSRTSKTPTCIYLANRGIKAANIPLVPGRPMPDLEHLTKPLIVGLMKDADSLIEIRRNRLNFLHQNENTAYTDPEQVYEELRAARRFFTRLECPVIDVSHKSIEETSAEIIMLLGNRASEPAAERPMS